MPGQRWSRLLRYLAPAVPCVLVSAITSGVHANEEWEEVAKLRASDGENADNYSGAISIDSNLAIIGAPQHSDGVASAGAAYVYDLSTGQELFKLEATDRQASDAFGYSVALEGSLAVIGATGEDDNGSDAGAAYIFDVTTGQQLHKLIASDGETHDLFGLSVAISGNRVLIGAPGDDDVANSAGAVYVFDTSTGQQVRKITAVNSVEADGVGKSVALNGNLALVGAWQDDEKGFQAGAAYVFNIDTGAELRKLTASDGSSPARFGVDVDLSGAVAVIGASVDDENGNGSGAAYLFDVSTGVELIKLIADDGAVDDEFGRSVAIDGNVVLVGANGDDDLGSEAGSAYFFDAATGLQIGKVVASNGTDDDQFGRAVDLDSGSAIMGSNHQITPSRSGVAYVFQPVTPTSDLFVIPNPMRAGQNAQFIVRNATPDEDTYLAYSTKGLGSTYVGFLNVTLDLRRPNQAGKKKQTDAFGDVTWSLPIDESHDGLDVWLQAAQFENKTNVVATTIIGDTSCDSPVLLDKLKAGDPSNGALFGNHVALHNNMLAIGSRTDDDNGSNSGSAYLFDVSTGTELRKLLPPDGDSFDQFGFAVAVNDHYVLVGSPEHGIGAVYVFDLNSGAPVYKLVPIDSSGSALFGHSIAVHGDIAVVGAPATLDHNVPGAAYVFDLSDGDEIAKLVADDGAAGDFFGWSVALDDVHIVVGAQGADVEGEGSGAAYFFGHGDPNQLGKITPNDPAAFDRFGRAVAVDGDFVLVGAPFDDNSNGTNAGAVYLFNAFNGNELAKFLASDGANNAGFGNAIAYDAASQLATVCSDNVSAGLRAYAFDMTTGEEMFVINNTAHGFGDSVTLEGTTMVVGAWGDDEVEGDSGAAFVYCLCCQ